MSVSVGLLRPVTDDASLCRKIAAHETIRQPGVIKLLGGVSIRLNTRYHAVVSVDIQAEFGEDFVQMANNVQKAIFRGIDEATDLKIAAIHVRVAGVKHVGHFSYSLESEATKETVQ